MNVSKQTSNIQHLCNHYGNWKWTSMNPFFFFFFSHLVSWEPGGRYHYRKSTVIAPCWLSSDDLSKHQQKCSHSQYIFQSFVFTALPNIGKCLGLILILSRPTLTEDGEVREVLESVLDDAAIVWGQGIQVGGQALISIAGNTQPNIQYSYINIMFWFVIPLHSIFSYFQSLAIVFSFQYTFQSFVFTPASQT